MALHNWEAWVLLCAILYLLFMFGYVNTKPVFSAHIGLKWTEWLEDLLWVCERSAKLIAVLELFEYVMSW